MKTEIRITPDGYEVWYSTKHTKRAHFHKRFILWQDALMETTILKGCMKLMADLKK